MIYDNLPGIHTLLRDGGLVVERPGASTDSILIIVCSGVALSGGAAQECNPVWVPNETVWEKQGFGARSNTNRLYTTWKEAIDGGCQDVRVLQVFGTTAAEKYQNLHTVYKALEDYNVDIVVLDGIYADSDVGSPTFDPVEDKLDYCSVGAAEIDVVAETPTGAINGTNKVYTLEHGFILEGSIVLTLTVDSTTTTLIEVEDLTSSASNTYKVNYITGGIELKTAPAEESTLAVAYTYYNVDSTYGGRSFAAQLNGFLHVVSERISQTIGVMAMKPAANTSLSTVKQYIEGLSPQVYSGLLQLVAGPQAVFRDTAGNYYATSGVGSYAALISTLPAQSGTTFKVLPGAIGLDYNLSPAHQSEMINKNLVVFVNKNGQIKVLDGITTAGASSDYARLTTVRIVNDLVEGVREIGEPFIGEPNDLAHRNALDAKIKALIKAMVKAGALTAANAVIKATNEQVISGSLAITLDVVPAFELTKITTTIALRPNL
jgi:hypothetical protein